MTYNEHKKLVKRVKVSILFIILGLLCIGGRYLLAPMVETEIANANNLTTLDSSVSSTMNELATYEAAIDASGKMIVSLSENKDVYVKNLGLLCNANGLNIHKMTVDDIQVDANKISYMTVELQLQGGLRSVKEFVSDIYASQMLCRINSVSYRLANENFSWMWRAIDDDSMIEWWDISSIKDYLLEDPDATLNEDELDLLGANAFMEHGTALCYLNVMFIGTEG